MPKMDKIDIKNTTFNYNSTKNLIIEERCGFNFDIAIETIIDSQNLLGVQRHPNQKKYPHQMIFVIKIKNYVYIIPFVYKISKNEAFLKTMYPSRKLTKRYINEKKGQI